MKNPNNYLASEKSPYLLQHKDNPVNWYPWGEAAFSKARTEKKPIFLSIGYSTCYWCHVMEKNSFETQEVADVLNAHFVSIKVDREERPDVDQIYMDAVVGLTGHGGWPMSVFLTPELKPFYGGTFFYKEQFIPLLQAINKSWAEEHENVLSSAERITQFLRSVGEKTGETTPDKKLLKRAFEELEKSFDAKWGGFGKAPKFPQSERAAFLLRSYREDRNKKALEVASKTLEQMARGGIYDHLGGGFSRYSTDEKWLVPHFEKMLYDNALLAHVYLEAYQVTKNEMFASVARETLDYLLRDMLDKSGGFHSAEDAGEVGKEGEYYVWGLPELKTVLTADELKLIGDVYGTKGSPYFEGKYFILHLQPEFGWEVKANPLLKDAHTKLLAARSKRARPHRDDKILTAWNALTIQALAKGYQVLGEKRYLEAGERCAAFLRDKLYKNGTLLRRYRDGESKFNGYQDDYAFFIQALITLYESDFDESWLALARELQDKSDALFWDENGGGYFYSNPDDKSIVARRKVFFDNAEPSGNSIAALNLLRLYGLTVERHYKEQALRVLAAAERTCSEYPSGCAAGLNAVHYALSRMKEVAIVGEKESEKDGGASAEFLKAAYAEFNPHKVLAFRSEAQKESPNTPAVLSGKIARGGKTTFYVCEDGSCKVPTTEVNKALELMR